MYATSELFKVHAKEVLPVIGLIYYSMIIMVKKSLDTKDGSLPALEKLGTSRKFNLKLARARKKSHERDITHIGCKLFNQLPEDIKTVTNINVFKSKVKLFLLSRIDSLLKTGQFTINNLFL